MAQNNTSDNEQLIQVLSLEYQALRDEMMVRTSGRFQFFGLMTTAAALLVAGLGNLASGPGIWVSGALAMAVFVLGLIFFFTLGHHIVQLSARIAQIERKINALLPSQPDGQGVLSWESEHQQRGLLSGIVYGYFSRRGKRPNNE
jgi:fatty acid desaturase